MFGPQIQESIFITKFLVTKSDIVSATLTVKHLVRVYFKSP